MTRAGKRWVVIPVSPQKAKGPSFDGPFSFSARTMLRIALPNKGRLAADCIALFDDAVTTQDFILPVEVWPDGTIQLEDGLRFGAQQS